MGNMYYMCGKGDVTRVCRINLNVLIASSRIDFVSVRSKPKEPDKIQP